MCDVFSAFLSADSSQNVVYQNEDGEWVTDLAYYSSFEKEVDSNTPEDVGQFQAEDFVPSGTYPVLCYAYVQILLLKCFLSHCGLLNVFCFLADDAMKKILKDQEEFEKEHQFMQV